MHLPTLLISTAFLALASAQDITEGPINGNVNNGVATLDGYTCTGAIYVGCDNNPANGFCCVGAHAQNNVCNGGQATTCTEGSYTPLTALAAAAATTSASSGSSPASTSARATGASGSPASVASTGSSSTSSAAAATAGVLSGGKMGAAGLAAVVVKVLFL